MSHNLTLLAHSRPDGPVRRHDRGDVLDLGILVLLSLLKFLLFAGFNIL